MQNIWVVDLTSYGYTGESDRTESVEKTILGCDTCQFEKWYNLRKRYFFSRSDAENYIRPIAQKAYDLMISDMMDDEYCLQEVNEYKKRGLKEISKKDRTNFVVPTEHEYDRIGQNFASCYIVNVY